MRRTAAVVLGTLTGTALMVGARVGNATPGGDIAAGDGGVVVSGDGAGVAVSPGATHPGGKPSGNRTPGATTTPSPGAKPTTAPTTKGATGQPTATTPGKTPSPTKTTPKPPPTTAPPSGPKDGTYNAQALVNGGDYGTLSMSVTISGGRMTSISASESGGETNCYHSACNTLKPEALAAQSANVATVSGATYTSSAFRNALNAILNTANA